MNVAELERRLAEIENRHIALAAQVGAPGEKSHFGKELGKSILAAIITVITAVATAYIVTTLTLRQTAPTTLATASAEQLAERLFEIARLMHELRDGFVAQCDGIAENPQTRFVLTDETRKTRDTLRGEVQRALLPAHVRKPIEDFTDIIANGQVTLEAGAAVITGTNESRREKARTLAKKVETHRAVAHAAIEKFAFARD